MNDETPKQPKLFIFTEKRAASLIDETLLNEKLSHFLIKKYETDNAATNNAVFAKLCEFFICNRALYEAVTNIELTKEKRYNEKEKGFGYIIEKVEATVLQMLVSTIDMVKLELVYYNINFTVH